VVISLVSLLANSFCAKLNQEVIHLSGLSSVFWPLLLQLTLIVINAIFACAEIAIISINDTKLAKLTAQGDKRAIRLSKLTSQPARFLSTIQVGITLAVFWPALLLRITFPIVWLHF
jgi:CBS domain containing-hemolysin-like protein